MKKKRSIIKIICLILVLSLCLIPVYAEDVIEFIPYNEGNSFVVFDMYADVKCSAAQSQEILDFVNQIRREACDSGTFFTWTGRYLSSADYVPLTWSGALERYALTRAVDIMFIFSHGAYSVEGAVAGSSSNAKSENICWTGYDVSPMVLLKIYYEERNVYLAAYNKAVAAGVPADQMAAYINANVTGSIGHYMSLINPDYRSIGSATLGRGVTKNVTLLSPNAGDGNFFNTSGAHLLRIPVSAGRLGSVFYFNYPKTINVGESATGSGFYLAGNTANDSFVRANNVQVVADNPEIVSVDSDTNTYTAHRKGTANFRIVGNGQQYGSFSIVVSVPVSSIEIGSLPDSLSYTQEGGYSLEGAQIKVIYQDGSSEFVPVSQQMVARQGRNGNTYEVVLAYQGRELLISFTDETPDYTVGLSVKAPNKLSYTTGDSLDLTGGQAILDSYHGVQTAIDLSDPRVSVGTFDSSYEGLKQVFVSIDGFTGSFTVNVARPVELTGIAVEPPEKTEYQAGEELDLTKGKLKLLYSNGAETVLALDESMGSGYNKDIVGTQAVQVSYNSFTSLFYVNVYGKPQDTEAIPDLGPEENPEPSGDPGKADVTEPADNPGTTIVAEPVNDPGQAELIELPVPVGPEEPVEPDEDDITEPDKDQVPMNVSDPWLVTQAIKLYGLRSESPARSEGMSANTLKGWPIRCINVLMHPKEFCRIKLQLD